MFFSGSGPWRVLVALAQRVSTCTLIGALAGSGLRPWYSCQRSLCVVTEQGSTCAVAVSLCTTVSGGQFCPMSGDEMEVQRAMPYSQQHFKQITPFSSYGFYLSKLLQQVYGSVKPTFMCVFLTRYCILPSFMLLKAYCILLEELLSMLQDSEANLEVQP